MRGKNGLKGLSLVEYNKSESETKLTKWPITLRKISQRLNEQKERSQCQVKFDFSFATACLTGKYEFPRSITKLLNVNQSNSRKLKNYPRVKVDLLNFVSFR